MKKSFVRTFIISLFLVIILNIFMNIFTELNYFVECFISYLLFSVILFIDLKPQRDTVKILSEECDPNKFLTEWVKYENYTSSKQHKITYSLNRCAGLIEQGNYNEALGILEGIDISKLNSVGSFIYYNNLMATLLHLDRFDKAKDAWNNVYTISKLPKSFQATKEYNTMYADLMRFNPSDENRRLFIANAERIFSENENKGSMHFKVTMKYAIGVAYFELGDIAKSKEYFTYAIENGNKLYTAQLSRQYLERINTP